MKRHVHGFHPYTSAKPRRRAKCVSISDNVCLQQLGSRTGRGVGGFILGHDAADLPVRCDGGLMVEPGDGHPVWTATGSLEAGDLTLSPSVLCKRDQFHGFVQNGKWVPA